MTIEQLRKFFIDTNSNQLTFEGKCHDCGKPVCVEADVDPKTWKLEIKGGAIYYIPSNTNKKLFLKCENCFKKNPTLKNFRECEVWSRVVGYLRPVNAWNEGKQTEYKQRKTFRI